MNKDETSKNTVFIIWKCILTLNVNTIQNFRIYNEGSEFLHLFIFLFI